MDEIVENIQLLGPVFAVAWGVTIASALLHPQRYRNSFLLMGALLVTMVFLASLFGNTAGPYVLLACFLLVMLALFLVPVLLILNGVEMIRKESICPAHLLSLGLGIVVGIGEIATVVYVLGIADLISLGDANLWVMLVSMAVFYFSFLVLSFVVYCVFIQIMPHRKNYNYIVIHGCGLVGGEKLSKLLSNRVDKAVEIYRKCAVKSVIIPSGGRGSDEKISEAQAMKDYLLGCGIPEESIVLEDRSTTTRENILFSKEIIDSRSGGKKTALISSNYHIYRCLRLAREVGFRCTGVGANVAMYYWPSAIIREFVTIFVTKGFLIWALLGYLIFVSPVFYLLVS